MADEMRGTISHEKLQSLWYAGKIRRLLRCRKTQRFFGQEGWTPDPVHARSFEDPIAAVQACVEHRLTDTELVLRMENSDRDLFTTGLS